MGLSIKELEASLEAKQGGASYTASSLLDLKTLLNNLGALRSQTPPTRPDAGDYYSGTTCTGHTSSDFPYSFPTGLSLGQINDRLSSLKSLVCNAQIVSQSYCTARTPVVCECNSRNDTVCGSRTAATCECNTRSDVSCSCNSRTAVACECNTRSDVSCSCNSRTACYCDNGCPSVCGVNNGEWCYCAARFVACNCYSRQYCGARTAVTCECNSRSDTLCSCNSRTAVACECNTRSDISCSCNTRTACDCNTRTDVSCSCNSRTACYCDGRCYCNAETTYA